MHNVSMNLFDMLQAASTVKPATKGRPWVAKNLARGPKCMTEKALARYKAALPVWTTTSQLEMRLGMSPTSANTTLRRFLALGLIERRPRDDKPYQRNRGWEWKWKNET